MKKTVILVSCHKDTPLIKEAPFIPIHAGFALAEPTAKEALKGMFNDADGGNISGKNGNYSELTSQYWAWKNYGKLGDPDYIGFFHYRRFLNFGRPLFHNISYFHNFSEKTVKKYHWHEPDITTACSGYDVVLPVPDIMYNSRGEKMTMREQYCEGHYKDDFNTMMECLFERFPEYADIFKKTEENFRNYYCNIFIMKKEFFFRYAEFLFDILFEVESKTELSDDKYGVYQRRVFGFLGERLLNFFLAMERSERSLKIKELQLMLGDFTKYRSNLRQVIIYLARKTGFRLVRNREGAEVSFGRLIFWKKKIGDHGSIHTLLNGLIKFTSK